MTNTNTNTNTNSVTTTDFDHNYHYSQTHYDNVSFENYVRHLAEIYNDVEYKDSTWGAVYQTGQSYRHGNYNAPSTKFELSVEGGTHPTLLKINELYESDFEDADIITNVIEDIDDISIKTKADLWAVYEALMDNNGFAQTEANSIFDENFKPKFIN